MKFRLTQRVRRKKGSLSVGWRKNVNNLTGEQYFSDLKAINVSQMRARNYCTG